MSTPMLQVSGLGKQYAGAWAIKELSFSLLQGETLVLLGTSGSGKTTTLRLLNRLLVPDTGEVLLNGNDIRRGPAELLRRGIGYVTQQAGLFPHYTVAENIAVVPRLLGWSKAHIHQRVDQLLALMQLEGFGPRYPASLSGGQQQRVNLARALAADAPLILLDEPFSALDPLTRSELQQELLRLGKTLHKTMVLVTHDVEEAVLLANQICLLHAGQLQQLGSPADLLFRPANEFVTGFLGTRRLSLELQVLTVGQLLPYLGDMAAAGTTPGREIATDARLLELIPLLDTAQVLTLVAGDTRYSATPEALFRAIFHLRRSLAKAA